MPDIDAELNRMEHWICGLLNGVSPSKRTQLTRNLASFLRGKQAQRIAAQRNPDGTPFAPRKAQAALTPRNRTLKFLYPAGGSGAPRAVLLKSWVKEGSVYKGYDIEAGGIRSFEKSKIIKWFTPTTDEANKSTRPLRVRPTIKQQIMFRKLRRYALLKSGFTPNEVWAGFTGRAAEIAREHQEGAERVTLKGRRIRTPERRLLGLSAADEQEMLDQLVAILSAK